MIENKEKTNFNKKFGSLDVYIDYTNNRLKISDNNKLDLKDIEEVIDYSKKNKFTKILVNSKLVNIKGYIGCGFLMEGFIKGFFKGEDACCLSYFLNKDRNFSLNKEKEDEIIRKCFENTNKIKSNKNLKGLEIRTLLEDDILQMINLFKKVFKTYPTPVFDKNYLLSVIDKKILFKGIFENNILISMASADLDNDNLNCEITDCATNENYRGRGFLGILIDSLEEEVKERGYKCLYSLSRAINYGINSSLSKKGYYYCGRLVNNCDICGGFEDMNIWVKDF
jgi:putative beta-lysine N-acetyltransferase